MRNISDPTYGAAKGRLKGYELTAVERRQRAIRLDEQLQAARRRAAEEKSLESAPTDTEATEPNSADN